MSKLIQSLRARIKELESENALLRIAAAGKLQHRAPIARIGRILTLLKQGDHPNMTTMADALGVSTKAIQRDLDFIRQEFRLPIKYNAAQHGFELVGDVKLDMFTTGKPEEMTALVSAFNHRK